ncbi:DapH/DapD/GlmU-related protein [uncultured Chitinophaga sp.]|uniref:acyltransferase n=1 Tax=uncultured Chitinophaga sp. TaxID=339340 RepID=UPI0025FFA14F|nr:acyltransferase [uncultured Chitinophaga sp.]
MLKLCKKKFHHFADTAELRPGCYVVGCSQISIGNRVVIRPNTQLHGETATAAVSIVIEDDVLIGSGVNIYVENHRFSNPDIPIIDQGHESSRPVRICKGAWLGANVVVLPGVTIGEGAVIGAGAVVTKDIPPHGVAVGAAARVVKQLR